MKAFSDISLAHHHEAMALYDRAKAGLETAKSFKELDEMNGKRLMNLADFILSVQERQQEVQLKEDESTMNMMMMSQKSQNNTQMAAQQ
jgi:hypothetical protein